MNVLVVGDVISDDYIDVETNRTAAEARIPVYDELHRYSKHGGAWNVADNIKSMYPSLNVFLAGILGSRRRQGSPYDVDSASLCVGSSEMTKTRYVLDGKIIFRHDDNLRMDPIDVEFLRENLSHLVHVKKPQFDAVVFSDYDKGTLTAEIIGICSQLSKLIVIDSKRLDLSPFVVRDATTILKLNENEWSRQVSNGPQCLEAWFDFVVVTKGADGAQLRQFDKKESGINRFMIHSEDFPAKVVKAVDVTGCGDTHTAAMVVSLLKDPYEIRNAVRYANEMASLAVQQFGTTVVR